MRFFRIFCVVVAAVLLFNIPVYAGENTARSSSYIALYDSALVKGTGTELNVWFHVVGTDTMDEIGAREIRVQQRSSPDENWKTVITFRSENYPTMICQNTGYHSTHVTCRVTPGYYYRAIVIIYAAKDNGSGSIADYAEVIYIPPL